MKENDLKIKKRKGIREVEGERKEHFPSANNAKQEFPALE